MDKNFAFIDTQNVFLSLKEDNKKIDWKKFRIYLKEKHNVQKAYMFLGYLPKNQAFYQFLKRVNYTLVFKEITLHKGTIKGNVDAELVLQAAAIDFNQYDKAILVSNDGDFACLVKFLSTNHKFLKLISPNLKKCSKLLKKSAKKKTQEIPKKCLGHPETT